MGAAACLMDLWKTGKSKEDRDICITSNRNVPDYICVWLSLQHHSSQDYVKCKKVATKKRALHRFHSVHLSVARSRSVCVHACICVCVLRVNESPLWIQWLPGFKPILTVGKRGQLGSKPLNNIAFRDGYNFSFLIKPVIVCSVIDDKVYLQMTYPCADERQFAFKRRGGKQTTTSVLARQKHVKNVMWVV